MTSMITGKINCQKGKENKNGDRRFYFAHIQVWSLLLFSVIKISLPSII